MLATTGQGLLRSTDARTTWAPVDGAPPLQVVTWVDGGLVAIRVDAAGTLWRSTDGGYTW